MKFWIFKIKKSAETEQYQSQKPFAGDKKTTVIMNIFKIQTDSQIHLIRALT